MDNEVVYFVAIRTSNPAAGSEVAAAMSALNESGLFTKPPLQDADHAVAWYRPYSELTANDHEHLRGLGLDFDEANQIITVASVEP